VQVGIGPRRLIGSITRGELFGANAVGCSRSNSPGAMLKCLAKGRLDDDDFDEDTARFGTPGMLLCARDVAGPRVSGRSRPGSGPTLVECCMRSPTGSVATAFLCEMGLPLRRCLCGLLDCCHREPSAGAVTNDY
jgi:hypothetical protein